MLTRWERAQLPSVSYEKPPKPHSRASHAMQAAGNSARPFAHPMTGHADNCALRDAQSAQSKASTVKFTLVWPKAAAIMRTVEQSKATTSAAATGGPSTLPCRTSLDPSQGEMLLTRLEDKCSKVRAPACATGLFFYFSNPLRER